MREKELRLALVCYGGISLAVYMHGITKEIWRLLRASRAFHAGDPPSEGSESVYHRLLDDIAKAHGLKLQVFSDIIAGASAGGINGIFLAQAISTGQSLEPLTALWLDSADVEQLLDPDARPIGRFTKFWAQPIAWLATRKPGGTVEQTVGIEARDEVRAKLTQFVRARWFEPPFGGAVFSNLLLNAFDAMEKSGGGPALLPPEQPLDLFVTVTDFRGHPERLRLHSPREIAEQEHRLTLSFRHCEIDGTRLGQAPSLTYAARATASFPGAFPPLCVGEIDAIVKARKIAWSERGTFLSRILPRTPGKAEALVLIDGSVLANAPFRPAIEALRDRPARREVDRRFVYIDPKPGIRAVSLTRGGQTALPGFFSTILGAMSDIPREQPIRDSLEAIEGRSARIRRMQRIVEAVRPEVEASVQSLFGRTFFLDRPTGARLANWRRKAQERAALEAGHAYASYGHVKLSGVVEEIVGLADRCNAELHGPTLDLFRQAVWTEVRQRGADAITGPKRKGASDATIAFFRDHDIRFRIRRLRFVARTMIEMLDRGETTDGVTEPLRNTVYALLAPYLDRESTNFIGTLDATDPAALLDRVAALRDLTLLDDHTDELLAEALAACPKAERRAGLLAYVGFPYFDISTLPLLQGEGLDEFDPIKVDRIAPDDARSIRDGGAPATLKGIEFNSFGAFFSRAYRENDYLWGRLHGAERLIDIVLSTLPSAVEPDMIATVKRQAFEAILDEEVTRLRTIPGLFETLRSEIAAGPLANPEKSP
jgi:patatin-related protein